MKGHVTKQMDDKTKEFTKALSKIENQETANDMVKIYDIEIKNLKSKLTDLSQKEISIIGKTHAWTQSLVKWLELMRNAYIYWKNANPDQKKFIAENIFLELEIKNGKIASYKYLDAPGALKKANSVPSGGPVGQRLEPLIEMFRLDEKALVYAERFINQLDHKSLLFCVL